MGNIITRDRSIIPACDFPLESPTGEPDFRWIVYHTMDNDKIGGYKIGPALTGRPGYDAVVEVGRFSDKPLIFDGQKWGTDILDTAKPMLEPLKEAGFDAVILFPQAGPITEYEWIKTAQDLELGVIVGGHMTHPGYREGDKIHSDKKDYGKIFEEELEMLLPTGFIRRDASIHIYQIAAKMGVTDFVVPGNQPKEIEKIRNMLENTLEVENASYFAPGFVAQGGEITESGDLAGDRFHAIVGRGIYQGNPIGRNVRELTSKI